MTSDTPAAPCPTCGGTGEAPLAQPTTHQRTPGHGPDSDELDWIVSEEKYPCLDCLGTGKAPAHNLVPPEGCVCASFWTIRGKHKADCPLAEGGFEEASIELQEVRVSQIVSWDDTDLKSILVALLMSAHHAGNWQQDFGPGKLQPFLEAVEKYVAQREARAVEAFAER